MKFCSGQRCTAIKVICVMESVAEELVKKIVEKVAKLKVGMPEDNCDITPVVSQSSANFIQGLVEDAKAKGAKFHQVCTSFVTKQQFIHCRSQFPIKTHVFFNVSRIFPLAPRLIICCCAGVEERKQLDLPTSA